MPGVSLATPDVSLDGAEASSTSDMSGLVGPPTSGLVDPPEETDAPAAPDAVPDAVPEGFAGRRLHEHVSVPAGVRSVPHIGHCCPVSMWPSPETCPERLCSQ